MNKKVARATENHSFLENFANGYIQGYGCGEESAVRCSYRHVECPTGKYAVNGLRRS
jgi:hypothetical protein